MSDYPMLISNKLHSFRNFVQQNYQKKNNQQEKIPKNILRVCLWNV